jgi:NAD(P)-dependent dehydrogenase (short-subunit alcohol dehydrogenase family)
VSAGQPRVAVVTGGGGAIGGAIARALAAAGHTVVSIDTVPADTRPTDTRPTGTVPTEGGEILDQLADLAVADEVAAAAGAVIARHGRCDVLVHAAAAFDRAGLAAIDLAAWRRVQAVNVESALLLARAFAPGMAARGFGRIVFVVSDTIWLPAAPDMLAYVASKGALTALARSLAAALGSGGIAVTCVAPGLTATPAARAGVPPEAFGDVRSRQALPRTLVPADTAATVAFLASDAAAALTGQTVCTDGGLVMR